MVDVCLINPPVDGQGDFGDCLPLGLACLTTVLSEGGLSVECIDACVENYSVSEVVGKVVGLNPSVVGLSVLSAALPTAYEIIHALKRKGIKNVVVGGAHVSEDPDIVGPLGADYGVLGEGDCVFPEVVDKIKNEGELGSMMGVVDPKNPTTKKTKKLIIQPKRIPTPTRNSFKSKKYKFTPINLTRGCPYHCTYCSLSCTTYRRRELEPVIKEIKQLQQLRTPSMDFIDDVFTLDHEYVIELCETMEYEKIHIPWAATTRADLIDEELIRVMKRVGLWHLSFGVETGSEDRRRIIGKDISDREYEQVIDMCSRVGIKTRVYGMLGFPGESLSDMEHTISFLKGLKPDNMLVRLTDLVPGTELYKKALEEEYMLENIWREYMVGKKPYPIYIPEGVSFVDMKGVLAKVG